MPMAAHAGMASVGASNGGKCGPVVYPVSAAQPISLTAIDGNVAALPGAGYVVVWVAPAPQSQTQQGQVTVGNSVAQALIPAGGVAPIHVQFSPAVPMNGNFVLGFNTFDTSGTGVCVSAGAELVVQWQ